MKAVRYLLIFVLMITCAQPAFSEVSDAANKAKAAALADDGSTDKIVFLPFYDYTGSSMKYISDYIPELLMKRITVVEGISIYDRGALSRKINEQNLNASMLYDEATALDFLKTIDAKIGVGGRYLIQGKTILIDFHVLFLDKGKVLKGKLFEGVVDENILDTLNRFAESSVDWLKIEALSDVINRLEKKRKARDVVQLYYDKVKSSRVGFLLANNFSRAVMIFILFMLISYIVVLFFEKILKRIAGKTETTVDDDLIAVSKKPFKWIFIFIGIKLALAQFQFSASTALFLGNLTTVCIIAIVTFIVFKGSEILIRFWGEKVADRIDSRIDDDLVPLFVKVSKVFVLIMGFLLVMSKFGVEIGPLVASLGIAGFAIGFAVKDSLANIIGGVILILDKSFVVGDKVMIDDDVGIIKEVGLRNTKLQTFDHEMIVIPNGELMNKKFKNYVLPDPKIRVVINFGVAYGTDIELVEKVVMEAIMTIGDLCEDPAPSVVFHEMADFSLNFQGKFWVPIYENQYSKWIEGTKKIYKALVAANINIPFPTRTVYVEKGNE